MRSRTLTVVGVAAAALAFAGYAVAEQTLSQTATTATGSATTVSELRTSTCTSTNGTFESTRGRYTGSLSGASIFSGPLRIAAGTLVNTSTGIGVLAGRFAVDAPGKGSTRGSLQATLSKGTLAGWIEGRSASGRFAGTFTGTWDKSAGFGSLSLGTSSVGNLLVLTSGHCRRT